MTALPLRSLDFSMQSKQSFRITIIGMLSAVAFVLISSFGVCEAGGADAAKPPIVKASQALPARAAATYSSSAARDAWRYQYYGGYWWYWKPSNAWAWYNGRRWNDYAGARTRVSAVAVLHQSRNGQPERYKSETSPAPPETVEGLRKEMGEMEAKVRQLESRVEAHERQAAYPPGAGQAVRPWTRVDQARLDELWRVRRAAQRFYDLHSDVYYFTGKGHFTD